jgi:DNA-binding transcriptional ArsR family regulator
MEGNVDRLEAAGATGAGGTDADDDRRLGLDARFMLLKNRRRRAVLQTLRERGGESTLSDLAEAVGAEEHDVEPADLTTSQRKRVYVGLYQRHLPKLDDAGVVEFDRRGGGVALTAAADQLFPYLDGDAADGPSAFVDPRLRAGAAWALAALAGWAVVAGEAWVQVGVALVAGLLALVETAALVARATAG